MPNRLTNETINADLKGKWLTNEIIDKRLIGRKIKRIENYSSPKLKINWQCESCDHIWSNFPQRIMGGNGCPKCAYVNMAKNNTLTSQIIDERLIGRNIVRLDEYSGSGVKIKFQCLKENCNYIWAAAPNWITGIAQAGCPKCSGCLSLTNEIIDSRLIERKLNIKRLDNYLNIKTKIRFQCLKQECGFIWSAQPNNIFHRSGCPKCAKRLPVTNEIIDERIKNKSIKRLDDSLGSSVKIKWQCLINDCNYIWEAKPCKIFEGSGCPKCANRVKITNEIIDQKLSFKNIKRLDDCLGSLAKIKFQCLICFYEWKTNPCNILNKNTGCPKCKNCIKLTNEIFDQRISGRNIIRLDDYVDTRTKIRFKHDIPECGKIWLTVPLSVSKSSGCPDCKNKSKNKSEKLILSILEEYYIQYKYDYNIKNINNEAKNKRIDFYFPFLKLAIELNGAQHYEPICFGSMCQEEAEAAFLKQQERDQYLETWCSENNINLIWIDGRKYRDKKLIKYFHETIIPLLKKASNV